MEERRMIRGRDGVQRGKEKEQWVPTELVIRGKGIRVKRRERDKG